MLTPQQMGFTVRPNKGKTRTAIFSIEHSDMHNVYFTLYYRGPKRYLWRRSIYSKNYYCDTWEWSQNPLNMRRGKPVTEWDKKLNYRPYNIQMSEFTTFDEALEYFYNYIKKYHSEILNGAT